MGTAQSPEPAADASTGRVPVSSATSGDPTGTGIAHANRWAGGRATASRAVPSAGVDAARLAPLVVTRRPSAVSSTDTVPSRSVRSTRAPDACSRASVDGAGCPYGLPVPADATATRGRTASRKASVVAVRLP